MVQFILTSIGVFLITILLLVVILLVAKSYLSPSGNVNIEINGDKTISVGQGSSLMTTLNENGIFLPSACGGKASCGQCKVQVLEGGGEILDSERPHFTRKEIKDHWRLGCQCKVKGDLKIKVPESVLGVKEWECTVISNKNVSSFIKEFIVALPPGEHMDFIPGSYAQIKIPAYECIDYDKDFDKNDIGPDYLPLWPITRQRATALRLPYVLLPLPSSPNPRWASRMFLQESLRPISSQGNRAIRLS